MRARCLSTLAALPVEGYSLQAQRWLAGDDRPFPHRMTFQKRDLLRYRAQVVERVSVSGVQEKVSLRLTAGALEPTDVGGEYILKFTISDLPEFGEDVPANEHVTMLIAEHVFGIAIPPCALIRLADDELAYVVRRFDYRDGQKIPQEDFSQLMQRSSEAHGKLYKYESSYEEVGDALRLHSSDPTQIEDLFVRIAFNYALSNGDAHLKNFSLYRPDQGVGHILTPAYDLLCSSLHVPGERRLALEFFKDGDTTESFDAYGFETYADFVELARRFGIKTNRARALLQPFVKVQPALEELVRRSFLSGRAKEDYIARYRDRLHALQIGAPGDGRD